MTTSTVQLDLVPALHPVTKRLAKGRIRPFSVTFRLWGILMFYFKLIRWTNEKWKPPIIFTFAYWALLEVFDQTGSSQFCLTKSPLGSPVGIQRLSTTQIVLEGLFGPCARAPILLMRARRTTVCSLVADNNSDFYCVTAVRRHHILQFESNLYDRCVISVLCSKVILPIFPFKLPWVVDMVIQTSSHHQSHLFAVTLQMSLISCLFLIIVKCHTQQLQ